MTVERAHEAGIAATEFWQMTPYQTKLALAGAAARRRHDWRLARFLVSMIKAPIATSPHGARRAWAASDAAAHGPRAAPEPGAVWDKFKAFAAGHNAEVKARR